MASVNRKRSLGLIAVATLTVLMIAMLPRTFNGLVGRCLDEDSNTRLGIASCTILLHTWNLPVRTQAQFLDERSLKYYALRNYDKALADNLKAKGLLPSNGYLHGRIGVTYSYMKDNDRALEEFTAGHALDPKSTWILDWLDLLHKRLGNKEERASVLEKFLELKPEDWKEHAYHIMLLEELGRFEEVEAKYARLNAKYPDVWQVQAMPIGVLRGQEKNLEAALLVNELAIKTLKLTHISIVMQLCTNLGADCPDLDTAGRQERQALACDGALQHAIKLSPEGMLKEKSWTGPSDLEQLNDPQKAWAVAIKKTVDFIVSNRRAYRALYDIEDATLPKPSETSELLIAYYKLATCNEQAYRDGPHIDPELYDYNMRERHLFELYNDMAHLQRAQD